MAAIVTKYVGRLRRYDDLQWHNLPPKYYVLEAIVLTTQSYPEIVYTISFMYCMVTVTNSPSKLMVTYHPKIYNTNVKHA